MGITGTIVILIIAALAGGMIIFLLPERKDPNFGLSLIFAGAYLFSITIIHIIPEIYSHPLGGMNVGIYMLLGYFIQQILEFFSSGIEHGHMHHKSKGHNHTDVALVSVLLALLIHSFLEGGMLGNPTTLHANHKNYTLLAGIVLHKVPAAFALMSLVTCKTKNRAIISSVLLLFALASPMGLLISDHTLQNGLISEKSRLILSSIVAGSFLQISTTIVFESSPQHKFDYRRFGVALLGAITAIVSELI
jgi:zinc transporter ZupT